MNASLPNPRVPVATLRHLELSERVAALNDRYVSLSAQAIVQALVLDEFSGKIAVVSSFGAESAVLLHLVATVDRSVPVIFLDTLRHFQATLDYQTALAKHLGLRQVIIARPDAAGIAAEDPDNHLAVSDPDRCCYVRKTLPMIRALRPFSCLMTGRKRFQSETRAGLAVFEMQDRWVKANPLVGWSKAELDGYFSKFGLPPHPLEAEGFRSIGCEPCTTAVGQDADARAGRWAGLDKTECGIHDRRLRR